jgi:myosin heavy subunit
MLTLSEAARKLGISRAALDNWIKRLEIEKKKEGQIGLTTKEVEQIRKHRRSNSRRRDTDMTVTSSGRGAPAFVEQELKELKQVREQLQDLSEERLQWHKERSQHHDREESKRKELKNWEARLTETQRRADWLQEQLDSNSREKKRTAQTSRSVPATSSGEGAFAAENIGRETETATEVASSWRRGIPSSNF